VITFRAEKIFKILKTTSGHAYRPLEGNQIELEYRRVEEGAERYIYIDKKDRSFWQWAFRGFYRLIKTLYGALWFYSGPFIVLFLSFRVPYIINLP